MTSIEPFCYADYAENFFNWSSPYETKANTSENLDNVGGLDIKVFIFPFFFTFLCSPHEVANLTEKRIVSEQLFVSYISFRIFCLFRPQGCSTDKNGSKLEKLSLKIHIEKESKLIDFNLDSLFISRNNYSIIYVCNNLFLVVDFRITHIYIVTADKFYLCYCSPCRKGK